MSADRFELDPRFWTRLQAHEAASVLATETPEERLRAETVLRMRRWVDENAPVPALTTRCSSMRRKKPCRQITGVVYHTAFGYYIKTWTMPFVEAKVVHMADAHKMASEGKSDLANRSEIMADDKPVAYDAALHMPIPGLPDGRLLLGCLHHGNAAVRAEHLAHEASTARRTLNIDTLRKVIR